MYRNPSIFSPSDVYRRGTKAISNFDHEISEENLSVYL